MFDRIVADGDCTTTGGFVIARSDCFNEDNKAYARKGNLATCGNCKGGWPIYGTANSWLDDGLPMVKHMDRVLCPCQNNFVLAVGNSGVFYSDGCENQLTTVSPTETLVYRQRYTLTDSDGQPLSNVRYRIRIGTEVIASGATDPQGMTKIITTGRPERLILEISEHI